MAQTSTTTQMAESAGTVTKLTLYRFESDESIFSSAMFCNKLETMLRFSHVPYKTAQSNPYLAPRRKLPFIRLTDSGEPIPDTELIYGTLIEKGRCSCLDAEAGLTKSEKAKSEAIRILVENKLSNLLVHERVIDNWYTTRDAYLAVVPWAIRVAIGYWIIYRPAYSSQWAEGTARYTLEERVRMMDTALDALETFVQESSTGYLLGKKAPTRVDATVFGWIIAALSYSALSPKFTDGLKKRPALVEYAGGIAREWYPDRKVSF